MWESVWSFLGKKGPIFWFLISPDLLFANFQLRHFHLTIRSLPAIQRSEEFEGVIQASRLHYSKDLKLDPLKQWHDNYVAQRRVKSLASGNRWLGTPTSQSCMNADYLCDRSPWPLVRIRAVAGTEGRLLRSDGDIPASKNKKKEASSHGILRSRIQILWHVGYADQRFLQKPRMVSLLRSFQTDFQWYQ